MLVPLLFTLLSLQTTFAYYDPGMQRWINRDPVDELGFRVVRRPESSATQPHAYLFVKNEPANGIDALGLTHAPPDTPDNDYWIKLGQCLAIGQDRSKEFKELGRQGRLRTGADKWYHCVTSCEMTRACGAGTALALSELWEFAYPGGPDDTAQDRQANRAGRGCGGCKEKRSCEQCCEDQGYRR
jgi:hypothetical protein